MGKRMLLRTTLVAISMLCVKFGFAANLITNPDFTHDFDGWSLIDDSGTLSLDTSIGMLVPPSMHVAVAAGALAATATTDCIPINSANVDMGYSVFVRRGSASGALIPFSGAECSGALDPVTTISASPKDTWQGRGFAGFPLPDGTHSARVELTVSGAGGDANFDHIAFGPSNTAFDFIPLGQEGLSGTWYNPAASGQGFMFSVLPDASTGAVSVFGAWYTFGLEPGGLDTQRWYSAQAIAPSGAHQADLTIYRNVGGRFDAPPSTTATPVGTAVLAFWSCTSGEFDYDLDDGRSGSIVIQSLFPSVACSETGTPSPAPADFGLSGVWYDPSTSGQGVVVDVDPIGGQMFGGWFTYAFSSSGADGVEAQRWFSLQAAHETGSLSTDLIVYSTTEGAFAAGATSSTEPVGTATFTHTSCATATLEYVFDATWGGAEGSIDLIRLGATPEACAIGD